MSVMMRMLVVVMVLMMLVVFVMVVLTSAVMPVPTRPLNRFIYELTHSWTVAPRRVVPTDKFDVRAGIVLTLPHALAPMNLRRLTLRSELWVPHVDDLSRQCLVERVQRVHGA